MDRGGRRGLSRFLKMGSGVFRSFFIIIKWTWEFPKICSLTLPPLPPPPTIRYKRVLRFVVFIVKREKNNSLWCFLFSPIVQEMIPQIVRNNVIQNRQTSLSATFVIKKLEVKYWDDGEFKQTDGNEVLTWRGIQANWWRRSIDMTENFSRLIRTKFWDEEKSGKLMVTEYKHLSLSFKRQPK